MTDYKEVSAVELEEMLARMASSSAYSQIQVTVNMGKVRHLLANPHAMIEFTLDTLARRAHDDDEFLILLTVFLREAVTRFRKRLTMRQLLRALTVLALSHQHTSMANEERASP